MNFHPHPKKTAICPDTAITLQQLALELNTTANGKQQGCTLYTRTHGGGTEETDTRQRDREQKNTIDGERWHTEKADRETERADRERAERERAERERKLIDQQHIGSVDSTLLSSPRRGLL
jgi:hypothetical protein